MKQYDTFIIGHLCIDEILNSAGEGEFSIGGAVVYSSYAALAGGNHVGILIKSAPREKMIPYILPVHTEDIYWLRSDSETTSIRNQFLDDKHERRITLRWHRAVPSLWRSCRKASLRRSISWRTDEGRL